jgi:DNA sulfur modification protein DndC
VLRDLCGDDRLHYELTRELLSVTGQQRSLGRRAGLFEQLEKTIRRHFYDDKEDAIDRAQRISDERKRRETALQFGLNGLGAEPDTLEYKE